ncbi:MAG: kinase, partial [Deinococcales bacterium]
VQDILDAARSVESEDVIVLPNNKNVIMAAQKAAELETEKRLHVIPTRTLGQGLGASFRFSNSTPVAELLPEMTEASARVLTFEVTRASRTATIDGLEIQEGEVIGLRDDVLVYSGGTPEQAVLEMLKGSYTMQEVVTVFTGPNVTPEMAEALVSSLAEQLPQLGVEVMTGGPDLYDYLVTME